MVIFASWPCATHRIMEGAACAFLKAKGTQVTQQQETLHSPPTYSRRCGLKQVLGSPACSLWPLAPVCAFEACFVFSACFNVVSVQPSNFIELNLETAPVQAYVLSRRAM